MGAASAAVGIGVIPAKRNIPLRGHREVKSRSRSGSGQMETRGGRNALYVVSVEGGKGERTQLTTVRRKMKGPSKGGTTHVGLDWIGGDGEETLQRISHRAAIDERFTVADDFNGIKSDNRETFEEGIVGPGRGNFGEES